MENVLHRTESEIYAMPISKFRRDSVVAIKILNVGAMNKLDLVGDVNREEADRKRIAYLRANGHLG